MIFVAALRSINDDYIEAATIEGANSFQIFWRIKLPLIKPVLGMVAILTFVNSFNALPIYQVIWTLHYWLHVLTMFVYCQLAANWLLSPVL
jgi:raffinose/stachyose/melibiose transport system permease protein